MKIWFLAAVLTSTLSAASLDDGYRQCCNLQFDQAPQPLHELGHANPGKPLGPASDAAAYLFAEFDRLHILQSEFFAEDQSFLNLHQLSPDPKIKADFDQD